MKLHILTAITRPANIPAIAESLIRADWSGVDLTWHWRMDNDRTAVGGQVLKNAMLDDIRDGWVYLLDDDNLLHPHLPRQLVGHVAARPDVQLLVVGQELPSGQVRITGPDAMRVNHVDAAQLVIRRDALGDLRLPESYAGDGLLAAQLAATLPVERIIYVPLTLSYYNRLRWGES